jgi:N-methylhydantoinase A/oxoprolinase/acetone carboxylase beta subunit
MDKFGFAIDRGGTFTDVFGTDVYAAWNLPVSM